MTVWVVAFQVIFYPKVWTAAMAPEFPVGQLESNAEGVAEGLIRPPRMAGSPFGLRLRLRPKRLRSLGVFRWRFGRGG